MVRRGAGFLRNVGERAIGIGLGNSIFGFLMASGQRYMEISRILETVENRFRSADRSAALFGRRLGYTVAEGGQLVEVLGEVTNRLDLTQAKMLGGFANTMGIDPSMTTHTIARAGYLQGPALGNRQLVGMAGLATAQGMGEGRFEEFLRVYGQLSEQAFGQSGSVTHEGVMGALQLPGLVFDDTDPRARGQEGAAFIQGLNTLVSGRTGTGIQTAMMRAMGFGEAGGPSYIEMRRRMERGVFDQENVADLFGFLRGQGYTDPKVQFMALEQDARGAGLSADALWRMVQAFGSEEGVLGLRAAPADRSADFLGQLSSKDQDTLDRLGFGKLGESRVSEGAIRTVQIERMMMKVGPTILKATTDLGGAVENLVNALNTVIGINIGEVLTTATGAIRDLTGTLAEQKEMLASPRKALVRMFTDPLPEAPEGDLPVPVGDDYYDSMGTPPPRGGSR